MAKNELHWAWWVLAIFVAAVLIYKYFTTFVC